MISSLLGKINKQITLLELLTIVTLKPVPMLRIASVPITSSASTPGTCLHRISTH